MSGVGLFEPVVEGTEDLSIRFDGRPLPASRGETLIAVIMRHAPALGRSEFDGKPRAGFCLMGACQDCTVWTADGRRLRACMSEVEDGLDVRSRSPLADLADAGPDGGDD